MFRLGLLLALSFTLPACFQSAAAECREELRSTNARVRVLEEDKKKLEAQVAEQQRKIDSLLAQLSSGADEALRLKLQKQLAEARLEAERLGKGARPSKPCNCQPSDPLCSCL